MMTRKRSTHEDDDDDDAWYCRKEFELRKRNDVIEYISKLENKKEESLSLYSLKQN